MRKHISLLLGLSLCLMAICAIPTLPARAAGTTGTEAVTMFRLYNPNSGEHFYTKDESEKAGLVKEGWNDEGVGWIAPVTSDTPVYRLYNANAGDHHYTMNEKERDGLIIAGWNDEGIGWYSDDEKTVPLYREYNPNAVTGTHNYTTDKAEHDGLVKAGWHNEGIGWYGIEERKDDPAEPEDPTEPTDPTDPTEPTDPTDPVDPVDPTDPTDPTDPVDPTEPEEPEDPKEPEDDLKIGDTVILGTYEQDNNLTNGAEPIEWQYIANKDGHKMLMSKYILDAKKYVEKPLQVTWRNCDLRAWLNEDFYDTAFSDSDKKKITTAHNENPDSYELYKPYNKEGWQCDDEWIPPTIYGANGGDDTDDNVFLLSWTEARDLFDGKLLDIGEENPKLFGRATAYALRDGDTWNISTYADYDNGNSFWWLRSPGSYQGNGTVVTDYGGLGSSFGDSLYGIRPVILID